MPVEMERNIRAIVARGSGLASSDVIPGNDAGPRPIAPYATLLLVDDPRRGYPIKTPDIASMTRSTQHRRAIYSLQFYRKGAVDNALSFVTYIESDNGLTDAQDNEIRFVFPAGGMQFQRLDGIVGDSYEERAIVENGRLMVDYVHITDQDTGTIDTFNGDIIYGVQSITVDSP